jgi:hypothetical protein
MSSLPIEENYVRFEVFTAVTMKNDCVGDGHQQFNLPTELTFDIRNNESVVNCEI